MFDSCSTPTLKEQLNTLDAASLLVIRAIVRMLEAGQLE